MFSEVYIESKYSFFYPVFINKNLCVAIKLRIEQSDLKEWQLIGSPDDYVLTWNTLEQKQNPNITEYYAEYLTLIYKE